MASLMLSNLKVLGSSPSRGPAVKGALFHFNLAPATHISSASETR